MKKLLFSICLAALSALQVFGQNNFYEIVPRHEFSIYGTYGHNGLIYSIPTSYLPFTQTAGYTLSQEEMGTKPFQLKDMQWGGGLGYTWHITPWFGITTGAELAIYRQRFSLDGIKNDGDNPAYLITGQILDGKKDDYNQGGANKDFYYSAFALKDFSEIQQIYSVQIPLMLKFMAPLGPANRVHFYLGAGAKLGINILSSFHQEFADADILRLNGNFSQRDMFCLIDVANRYAGAAVPENTRPIDIVDNWVPTQGLDFRENAYYPDPTGNVLPGNEQEKKAFTREDGKYFSSPDEEKKGIESLAKINVMASAEAGFRWALAPGFGLYTGVYFDYGFMPLTKKSDNAGIIGMDENFSINSAHSILDASGIPTVKENNGNNTVNHQYVKASDNLVSKVSSIGAGVKLRLAFGSVAKKPQEPQIVYVDRVVRDTVVQTNTVTVRDTIVKTNTVIEKEIIRDTITIIKEIPVEIQKTMADLSNTMFDFNKSVIKDAAKGPLNSVVKWLQENPDVKVEISGHTDSVGSAAYNQRLSEARAKAVYDYFVSQGVDKFRLAYAGYGKDKPIATNETEEGRVQNRRVELNIIQ